MDSTVSRCTPLPKGASFPIKTAEEFDQMEMQVSDPAFKNGIVSSYCFQNFFFIVKKYISVGTGQHYCLLRFLFIYLFIFFFGINSL